MTQILCAQLEWSVRQFDQIDFGDGRLSKES